MKFLLILLLLVVACNAVVTFAETRRVLRVTKPQYSQRTICESAEMELLNARNCQQVMDAAFELLGVDVWGVKLSEGEELVVDIMVTRKQLKGLKKLLKGDLEYQVIVQDVDVLIAKGESYKDQTSDLDALKKKGWFQKYHDYASIKTYFESMSKQHGMEFIPSIGKTFEGRDIFAVKYSNSSKPVAQRKKVWIQAGIHAREWISHAVLQYIVANIATSNAQVLENLDFVFLPIVNPDGYEHTWKNDRLWRKNRREFNNAVGVDLNRNFPLGWNSGGGSSSPFSEVYQGPSAASELETQALMRLWTEEKPDMGIDLHAYSQLILRPYGYKSEPAPNEAESARLGIILSNAIHRVHGKRYVSEREIDLYQASGTDEDWWTSTGALAYTIELRPSAGEGGFGGDGFILSPKWIPATGEEVCSGLLTMWAEWTSQSA